MKAINYQHRSGGTRIDFSGTALLPNAHGEAKVQSKKGYIEIEAEFDKLQPATKYGSEYLTYVLWAITPEGRTSNLGEILLNGTSGKQHDAINDDPSHQGITLGRFRLKSLGHRHRLGKGLEAVHRGYFHRFETNPCK
jgi:hypothetical protein